MEKRDRFELLSAYLDGEVTLNERKQVEEWLSSDPGFKCLYTRLLALRQGMKSMPISTISQSAESKVDQLLTRLRGRFHRKIAIGGAISVACAIAAISGLFADRSPHLQMAQKPLSKPVSVAKVATKPPVIVSPLMVAINNPVIEIPQTAVTPIRQKPVKSPRKTQDGDRGIN